MKAILFDIDGTLIESMAVDTELYFASVNEILGPVRIRDKLTDYDHVTDSGILAQLFDDNGYPFDAGVAAAVRSAFVDSVRKHIETTGPFPAIDGAIQFFRKARESADVRVAIATGGWRGSALLKLASAGFEIDGTPLVTCDDAPSRIEIMQTALGRIDDEFDSVTYYGDAEWDRRACRSLGWKFVPVGRGLGGIESYAGIDL